MESTPEEFKTVFGEMIAMFSNGHKNIGGPSCFAFLKGKIHPSVLVVLKELDGISVPTLVVLSFTKCTFSF